MACGWTIVMLSKPLNIIGQFIHFLILSRKKRVLVLSCYHIPTVGSTGIWTFKNCRLGISLKLYVLFSILLMFWQNSTGIDRNWSWKWLKGANGVQWRLWKSSAFQQMSCEERWERTRDAKAGTTHHEHDFFSQEEPRLTVSFGTLHP